MVCRTPILCAAVGVICLGTSARADVFEFRPGTNANWSTSTNWTKTGTSARTIPNDPTDQAVINKVTTTDYSVAINSASRTVGHLTFAAGANYWTKIYLTSEWNTNATTLRFQAPSGSAILDASSNTTEATFGDRYNKTATGANNLGLILASPLQITKTTSSAFTVYMGYPGTGKQAPTSSANGSQYDITVTGSGTSAVTAAFQSQLSTNRSDYYVDAAGGPAVLSYFGDTALGDAANRIYLRSGGVARLAQTAVSTSGAVAGSVSTARTIFGTGSIQARLSATSGTLVDMTLDNGAVLSPGESIGRLTISASSLTFGTGSSLAIELQSDTSFDDISASGNVLLGGNLDLSPLYTPADGTSWKLMTATGTITGDFANKGALPAGFGYSIENSGHDLMLTYAIPEPSTLVLIGMSGLTLLRRRSR